MKCQICEKEMKLMNKNLEKHDYATYYNYMWYCEDCGSYAFEKNRKLINGERNVYTKFENNSFIKNKEII